MSKFFGASLLLFPLVVMGLTRPVEAGREEKQKSRVIEGNLPVHLAFLPPKYPGLKYSLLAYPPSKRGEKFPLLLALHGSGGSGRESLDIWKEEAKRRRVMVLCPLIDMIDIDTFYRLVEEVSAKYPVDKKKIYLAGVSSGALIARWILVDRPSAWKGVVFIASPTEEPWMSTADVSQFPSVLFVHGEQDHQFKIEGIVKHVEILKGRGIRVTLFRYPGAGHEHREEWNQEIFDWIEASYS